MSKADDLRKLAEQWHSSAGNNRTPAPEESARAAKAEEKATAFAHRLVTGFLAYLEVPAEPAQYLNLKSGALITAKNAPKLFLDEYGLWGVAFRIDLPPVVEIALGLSHQTGGIKEEDYFNVTVGRQGTTWVWSRLTPGQFYDDLYELIEEGIKANRAGPVLLGISEAKPGHIGFARAACS